MALENLEKKYKEGQERLEKINKMSPSELIEMLLSDITIRSSIHFKNIEYLLKDKPNIYKKMQANDDKFELMEITFAVWNSLKISNRGVSYKPEHGNFQLIIDYHT